VPHSPEIVHGLGNLIQNATEFAASEVRIVIRWDEEHITVRILDDGPGFDPGLLDRLGEPYLSGGVEDRDGKAIHMGLGVFIAQTLLERTGATLHFGNRAEGGAEVRVVWKRATLEAGPSNA
jgi:two-component system sensor histidine kinase RegB